MEVKTFEILDRSTSFPAMVVHIVSNIYKDNWLLARAGYGSPEHQKEYFLWLTIEEPYNLVVVPSDHDYGRTKMAAHAYISEHWKELHTGAVIDVEFILGETKTQKPSECKLDSAQILKDWGL